MSFQLIRQELLNQTYRGPAEACVYTFTVNMPDQLGASWQAEQHLNAHINELRNQGSIVLEYRLWEDKLSGTFTTDYKCEIVASASPLFWAIVIVAIIAIIGLLVTGWVINSIKNIFEYLGPGLTVGLGLFVFGILAVGALWLMKRRE